MSAPHFPTPLDPRVAKLVGMLNERQREDFEERAAIIEFESGGITRAEAEQEALLEVLCSLAELPAVRAFRLVSAEECRWIITLDPDLALARLHDQGAEKLEEHDLAEALRDPFRGLAFLVTAP